MNMNNRLILIENFVAGFKQFIKTISFIIVFLLYSFVLYYMSESSGERTMKDNTKVIMVEGILYNKSYFGECATELGGDITTYMGIKKSACATDRRNN